MIEPVQLLDQARAVGFTTFSAVGLLIGLASGALPGAYGVRRHRLAWAAAALAACGVAGAFVGFWAALPAAAIFVWGIRKAEDRAMGRAIRDVMAGAGRREPENADG